MLISTPFIIGLKIGDLYLFTKELLKLLSFEYIVLFGG